jgi:hypothetical protein
MSSASDKRVCKIYDVDIMELSYDRRSSVVATDTRGRSARFEHWPRCQVHATVLRLLRLFLLRLLTGSPRPRPKIAIAWPVDPGLVPRVRNLLGQAADVAGVRTEAPRGTGQPHFHRLQQGSQLKPQACAGS